MDPKFHPIEKLGSGHFGTVWRVKDEALQVERALKTISPSKVLDQKNFFHEAQILRKVEHENVVRVEEAGFSPDGDIYVAMEYLEKGSLEQEARGRYVDLTRVQRIITDVLCGLEHVHKLNIIHRDIKPGNIMIGQCQEGKLSDFGQAIPKGFDYSSLGVKDYAYLQHLAPEIYAGREFSVLSDIYACGVTLYRLVNGDMFMPSLPPDRLIPAIVKGIYPNRDRYRWFIPFGLRKLINKALHVTPSKRYKSAIEMRHGLEQMNLKVNWHESSIQGGTTWCCGKHNVYYEVIFQMMENGNYRVEARKGRLKEKTRRIMKHCHYNLTKNKAEKVAAKILQNFVEGKIK